MRRPRVPWELTREGSLLAGETVKERQVLKEATLARGSRSYGGHRQLAGIFSYSAGSQSRYPRNPNGTLIAYAALY